MTYAGATSGVATYNSIKSNVSADPKKAARTFYEELESLLAQFVGEGDLEWRGMVVPEALKWEAPGVTLMAEARNALSQMLEAPFAYYLNPMLQAERTISDLVGQG